MRKIAIGIMAFIAVGLIAHFVPSTNTAVNEEVNTASSTPIVVEEEVETDVVEEAQRELERINAGLDAEETRLLEERDKIDARLEKIIETRQSFQ